MKCTGVPFNKRFRNEMAYNIATTGKIGKSGKGPYLGSTSKPLSDNDIQVIFQEKSINYIEYLKEDLLPSGKELIDKYKLCCGHILNKNENVITNILGVRPHQVTSQTWATIYFDDNQDVIENVAKYISTKLIRFMVRLMLQSDGQTTCTEQCFRLVPNQDFTQSSDIDWTQSVEDIDRQLYIKYNISQNEIDYIENTIKPLT